MEPSKPQPQKLSAGRYQERLMLILIACFFGGVTVYSILPDGWVRGIAMTLLVGFLSHRLLKVWR